MASQETGCEEEKGTKRLDDRGGRTLTPSTRWCLATRLTYSSLFAEVTALRDPPGMRSTCGNKVEEPRGQKPRKR